MPLDDDSVAFAGEYVLGTLSAAERAQAEQRMGRDNEFAAAVLDWETWFAPIATAAAAIQPPVHLRRRIIEAITGAQSSSSGGNVVTLQRQLTLWRGFTFVATAIAAALAAFLLTRPAPPTLIGGKYVAVLQSEGPGPAFVATIDLALGTISVQRLGAAPQPGKAFELWAVGGGRDKPQSLGLIDASLKIPAEQLGKVDAATLGETVFAISEEPAGGSPTGQPTGPVLYTGKLVATE